MKRHLQILTCTLLGLIYSRNGFVNTQVVVSTFAGSGSAGSADGPASSAQFDKPTGMKSDAFGNLYVADQGTHEIRKITPAGEVSTIAGTGNSGSADGPRTSATFDKPIDLVLDRMGNIFVTEKDNDWIRKIDSNGHVSKFAGSGTTGSQNGLGTNARFDDPWGITIDQNGILYVTESAGKRIRKIFPNATVQTLAGTGSGGFTDGPGSIATFESLAGITCDASGNLFTLDCDDSGCLFRRISPTGHVTTLVGSTTIGNKDGQGTHGQMRAATVPVLGPNGDFFIADVDNHEIRRINSTFYLSSFAGTGTAGFSNGLSATFDKPQGIAIDPSGNIFVSDKENHVIRKISCKSAAGFSATAAGSCFPIACVSGTYQPNVDQTSCLPCPLNSICNFTTFQCNSGFGYNSSSNACVACSSSTFKPTISNAACVACPPGAVCNGTAFSCNIGFELNTAGNGCTACSMSTYKSTISNTACNACPTAAVCNGTAFTCNAGYAINSFLNGCIMITSSTLHETEYSTRKSTTIGVTSTPLQSSFMIRSSSTGVSINSALKLSSVTASPETIAPTSPRALTSTLKTTSVTTTVAATSVRVITSALKSSSVTTLLTPSVQVTSPSSVVEVSRQPLIVMNISLTKESPEKTFIDPANDMISIALELPQKSIFSDFLISFRVLVNGVDIGKSWSEISTLVSKSPRTPRYFIDSREFDSSVQGKNVSIFATVEAINKTRFTRPSATATLVLQFGASPADGECHLSGISTGVAWETEFNISCFDWKTMLDGNLVYSIVAVPVKTNDQLVRIRNDPTAEINELIQWPIVSGVPVGLNSIFKLPTGWREGNFSVVVIAEISVSTGCSTRVFVSKVTVTPFAIDQDPLAHQNLTEYSLSLTKRLSNATAEQTLQLAQSWSSALTDMADSTEKEKICNELLQSVATIFSDTANFTNKDIKTLQNAASTVGSLLTQQSVHFDINTQSAAVGMLANVAHTYLQQGVPVQIGQVQILAESFDAILKANYMERNFENSTTSGKSQEEEKTVEKNRRITADLVSGVNAITAAVAASLSINQPPVVIQSKTFKAVAQKTDLDSIAYIVSESNQVVSNLDAALRNYDFGTLNADFNNEQKAAVVLTKFTSFTKDPFAGLSSDELQNAKQRSMVSSFSLSDDAGQNLHIQNAPSCINLNFKGDFTFRYTITNTSLNASSIEFSNNTVILSKTKNSLNHTTFVLAPRCQYWNVEFNKWSTDGCTLVLSDKEPNQTTCCCNHLTDFSLEIGSLSDILSIKPELPPLNRVITMQDLAQIETFLFFMIFLVGIYICGIVLLLASRFIGSRTQRKISEAKIQAAPLPDSKFRRFKHVYFLILRIDHLWYSVLHDNSLISSFTQIQRWTICVTTLMTNLTIVTAFYASSIRNGVDSNILTDFVTGIYVSLITFPFIAGLRSLFDRPLNERPKKTTILSWSGFFICIVLLAADVYFLLAYAVSFPQSAFRPWLISFAGTVFEQIFISGPVKVVVMTILTVMGFSANLEKQLAERQEIARKFLETEGQSGKDDILTEFSSDFYTRRTQKSMTNIHPYESSYISRNAVTSRPRSASHDHRKDARNSCSSDKSPALKRGKSSSFTDFEILKTAPRSSTHRKESDARPKNHTRSRSHSHRSSHSHHSHHSSRS